MYYLPSFLETSGAKEAGRAAGYGRWEKTVGGYAANISLLLHLVTLLWLKTIFYGHFLRARKHFVW